MKNAKTALLIATIGLAVSAAWGALCPADPVPAKPLDRSLFDEAPTDRRTPDVSKEADAAPRGDSSLFAPSRVNRRSFWAEDLGQSVLSGDVLPLKEAAERMRDVQNMLGRAECGTATQHAQRQILDSLDRLLEQVGQYSGAAAKRPCQGSPGGKSSAGQKPGVNQGAQPGAPSGASGQSRGGTSRMDAAERRAMLKRLWGELPAGEREQMLQLPDEEFLPRYEALIEEYFRRLSEQQQDQPAGARLEK